MSTFHWMGGAKKQLVNKNENRKAKQQEMQRQFFKNNHDVAPPGAPFLPRAGLTAWGGGGTLSDAHAQKEGPVGHKTIDCFNEDVVLGSTKDTERDFEVSDQMQASRNDRRNAVPAEFVQASNQIKYRENRDNFVEQQGVVAIPDRSRKHGLSTREHRYPNKEEEIFETYSDCSPHFHYDVDEDQQMYPHSPMQVGHPTHEYNARGLSDHTGRDVAMLTNNYIPRARVLESQQQLMPASMGYEEGEDLMEEDEMEEVEDDPLRSPLEYRLGTRRDNEEGKRVWSSLVTKIKPARIYTATAHGASNLHSDPKRGQGRKQDGDELELFEFDPQNLSSKFSSTVSMIPGSIETDQNMSASSAHMVPGGGSEQHRGTISGAQCETLSASNRWKDVPRHFASTNFVDFNIPAFVQVEAIPLGDDKGLNPFESSIRSSRPPQGTHHTAESLSKESGIKRCSLLEESCAQLDKKRLRTWNSPSTEEHIVSPISIKPHLPGNRMLSNPLFDDVSSSRGSAKQLPQIQLHRPAESGKGRNMEVDADIASGGRHLNWEEVLSGNGQGKQLEKPFIGKDAKRPTSSVATHEDRRLPSSGNAREDSGWGLRDTKILAQHASCQCDMEQVPMAVLVTAPLQVHVSTQTDLGLEHDSEVPPKTIPTTAPMEIVSTSALVKEGSGPEFFLDASLHEYPRSGENSASSIHASLPRAMVVVGVVGRPTMSEPDVSPPVCTDSVNATAMLASTGTDNPPTETTYFTQEGSPLGVLKSLRFLSQDMIHTEPQEVHTPSRKNCSVVGIHSPASADELAKRDLFSLQQVISIPATFVVQPKTDYASLPQAAGSYQSTTTAPFEKTDSEKVWDVGTVSILNNLEFLQSSCSGEVDKVFGPQNTKERLLALTPNKDDQRDSLKHSPTTDNSEPELLPKNTSLFMLPRSVFPSQSTNTAISVFTSGSKDSSFVPPRKNVPSLFPLPTNLLSKSKPNDIVNQLEVGNSPANAQIRVYSANHATTELSQARGDGDVEISSQPSTPLKPKTSPGTKKRAWSDYDDPTNLLSKSKPNDIVRQLEVGDSPAAAQTCVYSANHATTELSHPRWDGDVEISSQSSTPLKPKTSPGTKKRAWSDHDERALKQEIEEKLKVAQESEPSEFVKDLCKRLESGKARKTDSSQSPSLSTSNDAALAMESDDESQVDVARCYTKHDTSPASCSSGQSATVKKVTEDMVDTVETILNSCVDSCFSDLMHHVWDEAQAAKAKSEGPV